jgi:hypothetical protein
MFRYERKDFGLIINFRFKNEYIRFFWGLK